MRGGRSFGLGPLGRSALGSSVIGITLRSGLGQGILAISSVVVASVAAPEQWGSYGAVLAWIAVIGPLAALRLDTAVAATEDAARAFAAYVLGKWSTVAVAILAAVLIPPAALGFLPGSDTQQRGLVALMVGVTALTQLRSALALRAGEPVLQGQSRLVHGGTTGVGHLGLAALGSTAGANLLSVDLLGRAAGLWPLRRLRVGASAPLRASLRQLWRYPVLVTGGSLLNGLALQLPMLLLPRLAGLRAAGVFFLAYRLVWQPLGLLVSAISAAVMSRARNTWASSSVTGDRAVATVAVASTLGICVFVPAIVTLAPVVASALGPTWSELTDVMVSLAIGGAAWGASGAIANLFFVAGQERLSPFYAGIELVAKALGLLVPAALGAGVVGMTAGFATATVVVNAAAAHRVLRVVGVRPRQALVPILPAGPLAVAAVLSVLVYVLLADGLTVSILAVRAIVMVAIVLNGLIAIRQLAARLAVPNEPGTDRPTPRSGERSSRRRRP